MLANHACGIKKKQASALDAKVPRISAAKPWEFYAGKTGLLSAAYPVSWHAYTPSVVRVRVRPGEHVMVHVPPTGLMPLQLDVSRPTMVWPMPVVVGMLGQAHRGSCSFVVLSERPNRLNGEGGCVEPKE